MEFKYKKIPTPSVVKSKDINASFKNIATDLYESFIQIMDNTSRNEAEIGANNDTLNAMLTKVTEVESTIASTDASKTLVSAYSSDNILYPSSVTATGQANHYTQFGQITLPILENKTQLMTLNEQSNELTLRYDAADFITQYLTNNKYSDRVDAHFQNDITDAFKEDMLNAFFVRALTSKSTVDYIENVVTVTLPATADINTIKVIPLPEFAVTIQNVTRSTAVLTQSTIKDVFGDTRTFPITQATRNIFHMPTYPTSEVVLTLRQPNYDTVNGSREFRQGLRYIAIENNTYANVGYFIVRFSYDASYPQLNSIIMDWDADSNSKIYLYETLDDANELNDNYILQGTGTTITPNVPITMSDQYYYLVVELRPIDATDATPVFRGCVINRVG